MSDHQPTRRRPWRLLSALAALALLASACSGSSDDGDSGPDNSEPGTDTSDSVEGGPTGDACPGTEVVAPGRPHGAT